MKKLTFVVVLILMVFILAACGGGGGGESGDSGGVHENAAPVAIAGLDQNVTTGSAVTLDGSTSSDANADLLSYSWRFVSIPNGSTATLSTTTGVKPTFTADKDGSYVLQLIVNDGTLNSATDTVSITVTTANSAPAANAGLDQNVTTGSAVTLDGSTSSDVNVDLLSYSWRFVSIPSGSTATLNSATVVKPTFTADKDGNYVLQLIVNDGTLNSAADTVSITVTTANSAPVANAGLDQNVTTGGTVTLNGSTSSDADADLLSYSWSFVSIPTDSNTMLSSAIAAKPTFTADKDGSYVFQLIVNDGMVNSATDTVTITTTPIIPTPTTSGVAPVAKTGQTTSYIVGSDGDLQTGVAWPSPRFTDNSNGTVTDNLTGLIWLKEANCFGAKTWNDALSSSNNLSSGSCGLLDGSSAGQWRLSNRRELMSLVDHERYFPALPAGHPFTGVQSDDYWSSSTFTFDSSNWLSAWYVDIDNGLASNKGKTGNGYLWPVRGGLWPLPAGTANPLAPVSKTGQSTIYATGDDGDLRSGIAWPVPRFVDHSNGTVTDKVTGLIWLKDANCFGTKIWSMAVSSPRNLASGGCGLIDGSVAGDWRLPTVNELESLLDIEQYNHALPTGHPFTGIQSNSFYWSSSTGKNSPVAWVILAGYGEVLVSYDLGNGFIWPVRGGQ